MNRTLFRYLSRFVMLRTLMPSVEMLCSSAEVEGGRMLSVSLPLKYTTSATVGAGSKSLEAMHPRNKFASLF